MNIKEETEYYKTRLKPALLRKDTPALIRLDGYHVTGNKHIDLFRGMFTKELFDATSEVCKDARIFAILDETNIIMDTKELAENFDDLNMVYISSFIAQKVSKLMVDFPDLILGTNIWQLDKDEVSDYMENRKKTELYTAAVYYHKRILRDNLHNLLMPEELISHTDISVNADFFNGYEKLSG